MASCSTAENKNVQMGQRIERAVAGPFKEDQLDRLVTAAAGNPVRRFRRVDETPLPVHRAAMDKNAYRDGRGNFPLQRTQR